MKKITLYLLLLLVMPTVLLAQNTATVGTTGANFTTLRAAFENINIGGLTENITLYIIDNTVEDATAILYESGHDGGITNYTSVTIYPTIAGLSISGDIDGPLIDLNGADNITFDGRVNQTGAKNLSIQNTSAGTSAATIRFIESAKTNTVKYCNILGSQGSSTGGIIFFSTDGIGDGGNSTNTISNNDITSYIATGRPVNVVYSSGSASPNENSGNIINNNNIYDFLNNGIDSKGIYLFSNTTGWTISGNSFYETASFAPSASVPFTIIQIDNTSGTGFTVSGNFIGGQAASCGGSAWTKTAGFNNVFTGIYLNVGTGTASSVQNNTIKNFNWSNSGAVSWTAINLAGGDINAGTITGNIIGANTGFIIITGGATNTNVIGINIAGSGITDCRHNNIGYISAGNSSGASATNLSGIRALPTGGTTTISNNTISNLSTTSPSTSNAQTLYGIYNTGTGTITLNNNTIATLTNSTTNLSTGTAGLVDGIASSAGVITVSNNIVHDLFIVNANTNQNQAASICGIALTGNVDLKTITGNTVYALSNTYVSFAGHIIGLYFAGNTGANVVSRNFIHSLSVTGASSTSATIYGIKIFGGTSTYSNNIIVLGGDTRTTLNGIYESGTATTATNLYFNTVYISGTLTAGATNLSSALYNFTNTTQRNFRNNIFVNARSTVGGSARHFAARITSGGTGSLICDYNDYFISGTGGMLGFYGGNKATLPIVTGQDVNSLNIDPTFVNPGSTNTADYQIVSASLPGVTGTGITVDFGLNPRGTTVTMGAWESGININKWIGTTSTEWGTITNWTSGVVPEADANIIFVDAPVNDCHLDIDRSVTDITNATANRVVTNGHKLTIKGALVFTGGAQIDASSASSIVEFAGSSAQTIPPGAFLNNEVQDLVINNANNVTLNGTVSLLNTITATLGRLGSGAVFYTPTMIYAGSAAQSVEANRYLNDRFYNLTIDNITGVSVNTAFTVDNNLLINSGRLLNISPGRLLTVTGGITNNAGVDGFMIKSDATGDGKLITNTSGFTGTVELFLTGDYTPTGSARFHYVVPPVQSMAFDNSSIVNTAADLGLTNFNGDLTLYSEPAAGSNKDAGWQYFDGYDYGYGPTTPFSSLVSSTGYNVFVTANDKITFKGTLNTAEHSFSNLSFTGLGWNLVGNPFPCNYDLNGISALTQADGVDNTIYFNHDGGFAYWNVLVGGTTGYSDIIAPMQGFFVLARATAQSVTLPVSSKTAATAAPLRSKGGDPVKKIKLVLNNGPVPDETIVWFNDKATTGFDSDFDGYKLFGRSTTSEPYIYSELEAVKYAINGVPEPDSTPVIIPLTVVLKAAGTYKIDITEFENLSAFTVVLKHGAVETTLSKDTSYSFTLAAGTYTDFQLIFTNIATAVENPVISKFKTWYSKNYLYINCPEDIPAANCKLLIYDIQGKIVYNNNLVYISPGQTNQVALSLKPGVYITHLIVNNQRFVSKIVIF